VVSTLGTGILDALANPARESKPVSPGPRQKVMDALNSLIRT